MEKHDRVYPGRPALLHPYFACTFVICCLLGLFIFLPLLFHIFLCLSIVPSLCILFFFHLYSLFFTKRTLHSSAPPLPSPSLLHNASSLLGILLFPLLLLFYVFLISFIFLVFFFLLFSKFCLFISFLFTSLFTEQLLSLFLYIWYQRTCLTCAL